MIYFDNAATSGIKPKRVIKTTENAMKYFSANPGRSGHLFSVKCADEVFKVREKVANFFGASGPENVVFTMNCTHSINCILKGVLKRGDHVLVSSFEHNAVMRPLIKTGIAFDIVNISLDNDDETVELFRKKIKPNTRMIFCTGASNVFGRILPIEKIGKLCRSKNILFAVDAAQIAGVKRINMKEMNIDYLAVAPHKGLYSPMGIGVLICEKPIENTILEGGTGTNSIELFQPEFLPEKLECGTVNVPGILGLGAGIDFVNEIGINKIHSYEIGLIEKIYSALAKNSNFSLYTQQPKTENFAAVFSFNIKGINSEITARFLSKKGIAVRGGLHCAPIAHKYMNTVNNGTVRVSTSVFNSISEVQAFISIITDEKNIKNLKKEVE